MLASDVWRNGDEVLNTMERQVERGNRDSQRMNFEAGYCQMRSGMRK